MDAISDSTSTVTSLFSEPKKSSGQCYYHEQAPIGKLGKQTFYSSSKLLLNYIHSYEKEQTMKLARSLNEQQRASSGFCGLHAVKEATISKEIKLARKLLPVDATKSDDTVESLTIDDLLISNRFSPGTINNNLPSKFCKSTPRHTVSTLQNRRPTPPYEAKMNEDSTCSMHFSDLTGKQIDDSQVTERSKETDNIYCLNGISYTPHCVKYRNILSKNMEHCNDSLKCRKDRSCTMHEQKNCLATPIQTSGNYDHSEIKSFSESWHSKIGLKPTTEDLTKDAGRTPFRTIHNTNLGIRDVFATGDMSCKLSMTDGFSTDSDTSASPTHFSVSFNLDDKSTEIREFMDRCLDDPKSSTSNFIQSQTGSVETLKNMLFTLQSLSPHTSSSIFAPGECGDGPNTVVDDTTGHSSLRKAMSHLSNLKQILMNPDTPSLNES